VTDRRAEVELVSPAIETETSVPVPLAPGVEDVDGLAVGLVDNGKWNAGRLLETVRERLIARHGMLPGPGCAKQHYNRDLDEGERTALTQGADVVLAAIGDCGSCTSYTVHDALALEQLGVPAVAIVTEPFLPLAESLAASLGTPALRIVAIPHPLYGIDDAALSKRADGVVDRLVAVLMEQRA
jgi:hypothetical protein